MGHRGPDSAGLLGWDQQGEAIDLRRSAVPPAIALLHTRLAILDLSPASRQPMASQDGRFCMVFNGEIYNYLELRKELVSLGHKFSTKGDSEVLLASFVEWGRHALTRLIGMFSFAILDLQERTIFAARDPFGIKPFYYATSGGAAFAFASEIKALLQLDWVGRAADAESLQRYLRFGATDGDARTMFRDVHQLPPGCYLRVPVDRPKDLSITRYWSLSDERLSEQDISFEQAAVELRSLFLDSVSLHMRSDVSIGSALSGGIDSSAIVMAMRHLGGPQLDLHTVSYISSAPHQSEEIWVDRVNTAAQAVAHKVHVETAGVISDINAALLAQDEPLASTSLYAQYCVFRAAKAAGITVMLDGQGADELLAGYPRYLGARMASLLRSGRFGEAVALTRHCKTDRGISAFSLLQDTADHMLSSRQQAPLRRMLGRELVQPWVSGEWFATRASQPSAPHSTRGSDVLRQSLRRDTSGGLVSLLRYEDRNSMAWSIESRVPFLTPQLGNFVAALPERYLIDERGTSKAVFREAMRGILPDEVARRSDKIGFETPDHTWNSENAAHVTEAIDSSGIYDQGFLDLRGVVDLISRSNGEASASAALWRLYFLARWTQQHDVVYE